MIYRSSGLVNENGEEIMDGIQYGICGYDNNEGGNTTFQGIEWKTTPTLSLPDTDILFKINDHVIVNLENGRIIEASVKANRSPTGRRNGRHDTLVNGRD